MTDNDVRHELAFYIFRNFKTKTSFAKHIGTSVAFVSAITSTNPLKKKRIPDYILQMIGVKRVETYTKETP